MNTLRAPISRRCIWAALASSCLAFARPAAAQAPSKADELFQRGLVAMRAGNFASACPMLAESYRLDPLPGALFTMAECEAGWGKVATAVEHYQVFLNDVTKMDAARHEKFEERRRIAVDKVAALGPLACELTVDLDASAPSEIVVRRNNVVVARTAYGVGKRVDPGEYVFTAEIEGQPTWERHVTLAQRDRARIDIPWPFAKAGPAVPKVVEAGPAPEKSSPLSPAWFYVVGGIGVAGMATGIITGAVALSQKGTIDTNCPGLVCNAEGYHAVTTGRTSALVSTISFPVGIVGIAGAAVLLIVSRPGGTPKTGAWHGVRPTLAVTNRLGTIGVEGDF